MTARIIASTCALIAGACAIAPAAAEPFNDRSLDWTTASPPATAARASQPWTPPPDGSFASSWGGGRTPTQYEGPAQASARLATGQSCEPTPRFGFNDTTASLVC